MAAHSAKDGGTPRCPGTSVSPGDRKGDPRGPLESELVDAKSVCYEVLDVHIDVVRVKL
jgi:hypothetical protein